jgi:hypothetical protein
MLKYLFLAVLCAPFGWVVYEEGWAAAEQAAPPEVGGDLPAATREGLQKAREDAHRLDEAGAEALPCAIAAGRLRPPAKGPRELAAVRAHAANLAAARYLLVHPAVERESWAKQFDEGHTLWQAWAKYRQSLGEAGAAQAKLRGQIERLARQREDWLVRTRAAESAGQAREAVAALDAFLAEHRKGRGGPGIEKLLEWAGKQRDEWALCERLLEHVRKAEGDGDGWRNHCLALAGLVKAAPEADGALAIARRAARRACDTALPREMKLDDFVELLEGGEFRAFPRNKVYVLWMMDKEKAILSESGFNEFTINESLVHRYFVDGPHPKPIRATAKSKAAWEYNQLRKNMRWEDASAWGVDTLNKLRDLCQVKEHAPHLRQELAAVNQMIALAEECPALFPPAKQ